MNFTIKASINLSQTTRLSVDFIRYFEVIQTKTYTSHVPTWSKSISDKIAAKKRRTPSKIVFLDVKTTFRYTFPSSDLQCLAIPETFVHNKGIRLVAHHSFHPCSNRLKVRAQVKFGSTRMKFGTGKVIYTAKFIQAELIFFVRLPCLSERCQMK